MSSILGNIDLATDYSSLSPSTKASIESEVRRFVEEGRQRATTLLTERRSELEILAKALVEYEVLSLDEIQRVLRGEKLQKLTALKGVGIKLPEMKLPPGIVGTGQGHGPSGGTPPPPPTSVTTTTAAAAAAAGGTDDTSEGGAGGATF